MHLFNPTLNVLSFISQAHYLDKVVKGMLFLPIFPIVFVFLFKKKKMHREHAVLRSHLFLIVTKVLPNVWKGELSSHLGRKPLRKCCDPVLTSYPCSYPSPCPCPPLPIISHPHPSYQVRRVRRKQKGLWIQQEPCTLVCFKLNVYGLFCNKQVSALSMWSLRGFDPWVQSLTWELWVMIYFRLVFIFLNIKTLWPQSLWLYRSAKSL